MPCESAGAGPRGAWRHPPPTRTRTTQTIFSLISSGLRSSPGGSKARRSCVTTRSKGGFRLDGKDQRGLVWVRREPAGAGDTTTHSGPPRVVILASNANDWRFETGSAQPRPFREPDFFSARQVLRGAHRRRRGASGIKSEAVGFRSLSGPAASPASLLRGVSWRRCALKATATSPTWGNF